MDYISDQKGILRRYFREKEGWNRHIEEAGSFIRNVLRLHEINHIVVLGSGWLLDFPLEDIVPSVDKITLVDVYFPPQILRKVQDLVKVECVAADITGGYISSIYDQSRKRNSAFFIPRDIPLPRIIPEKGKLILSLNILNQLDIMLVDYVSKYLNCGDEDIRKFRKIIQESHIHMLREHPFILITDIREIVINTSGKILSEKELIFSEIPAGELVQEWEWQFDTHQLYNTDANTQMKVRAVFSNGPHK